MKKKKKTCSLVIKNVEDWI